MLIQINSTCFGPTDHLHYKVLLFDIVKEVTSPTGQDVPVIWQIMCVRFGTISSGLCMFFVAVSCLLVLFFEVNAEARVKRGREMVVDENRLRSWV